MGMLVLSRYDALYVFAFDFGIFDQAIWSTAYKEFMWQSIDTQRLGSFFGIHFQPLLILLAPLYYIFPDGRFLLIVQTIFLALGAIPLYFIAKLKFKSRWIPVTFPLLYLLYPYLHNINLYDFHGIMFSPLFIGMIWYSIEKENTKLFILSVVATLLIKESMFIIVVLLCIYALYKTHDIKILILAIFSVVYGLLTIKLIIPAFSEKSYIFVNENTFQHISSHIPGTFYNIFMITEELFKPLLFLPLLNPIPYLTTILLLIWHSTRGYELFLRWHYSADVVALVFISLILGVSNIPKYIYYIKQKGYIKIDNKNIGNKNIELLQSRISIILVISSIYFFATMSQVTNLEPLEYQQTEHDRVGINLLKQIPPDVKVAAQGNLVPRLSHRKYIFLLPKVPDEYKGQIEYVIFDKKYETKREFWPYLSSEEYLKSFNEYYNSKFFDLVVSQDGYYIFKRI